MTEVKDFSGNPPLMEIEVLGYANGTLRVRIDVQSKGSPIAFIELPDKEKIYPTSEAATEMEIFWETSNVNFLLFTAFAADGSSISEMIDPDEEVAIESAPMIMSFASVMTQSAMHTLTPDEWTVGDVTIDIFPSGSYSSISSVESEVTKISASSFRVKSNGVYNFRIMWSDGSITTTAVSVSNIEKNPSARQINMLGGSTAEDWNTAAIREFLNSDKTRVSYTMAPPPYASEPGFLSSDNFTESEKDGIAVARHSGGSLLSTEGNRNGTEYLSLRSMISRAFAFNDRVFILNASDISAYVERNNKLTEMNRKHYTETIISETSLTGRYPYTMNMGAYHNSVYYYSMLFRTDMAALSAGRSTVHNIVPAMFLKPEFVVPSTGKPASALSLGSQVVFGKYVGEPIIWRVIYKSDEGHPLLWSEKILMRKAYSVQDVVLPNKPSKHINYSSFDVDIQSNASIKSWETQQEVPEFPSVNVTNPEVLLTPTNEDSITIRIRASDPAGIRRVVLPNETKAQEEFDWTITENGQYTIYAENGLGVITPYHIVTRAINVKAEFKIRTEPVLDGKWINKPIIAIAESSHQGVYVKDLPEQYRNWSGATTTSFPNWLPLGGKTLRVTGSLKHDIPPEAMDQANLSAPIHIRVSHRAYNISRVYETYPAVASVTLGSLVQNGQYDIDVTYKNPDNVYDNQRGSVDFGGNTTANYRFPHRYWMSAFKFEIVEKDDFTINRIVLPDGSSVSSDTATYSVNGAGDFLFKAYDNRGMEYQETLTIRMDTDLPEVSATKVTQGLSRSVLIKVSASDATSGVQRLVLPNGETRTNANENLGISEDYYVSENGTFKFTAYDFAGNSKSISVSVDNVYRTPPTLQATLSKATWTNQNVTINASASSSVGIAEIVLPNGSKVSSATASYEVEKNGSYEFRAVDSLGNVTILFVDATNIDKEPPTLNIDYSKAPTASPVDAILEVDSMSGITKVYVNSVVQSGPIVFSKNGTYVIKAQSAAGNATEKTVVVTNIAAGIMTAISMARTIQASKAGGFLGSSPSLHFKKLRANSGESKIRAGKSIDLLRSFFNL